MRFNLHIRQGNQIINPNPTVTYTVGNLANSVSFRQGQSLSLFSLTGGNIPANTPGTLVMNNITYTGIFNGAGQFVPNPSPALPISTPIGQQSFILTTSGLSNNPSLSGNVNITAQSIVYSIGTGSNYSATQGQPLGTISLIGSNIPDNTSGVITFGSNTINGIFNASGQFVPNTTPVVSSSTTVGSNPFSLTTTRLANNPIYNGTINVVASNNTLQKNIIFVGDSLTWGAGATSGSGTITGTTYPARVMINFPNDIGTNLGISGKTAAQMSSDSASQSNTYYQSTKNNIVVIHAGINDLRTGASVTTTYNNIVALCNTWNNKGFTTIICTNTAVTDSSAEPIRLQFVNLIKANYLTFADSLCDLAANSSVGITGASNSTQYFNGDMLHLNDAGNQVVANLVTNTINNVPNISTNTTFGTTALSSIPLVQGQVFPTIQFTGGNIIAGTVSTFGIVTPTGAVILSGTINSSGSFVPNAGSVIPSNATIGTQTPVISTSGLSTNLNANLSFNVQVSTPTPTSLNKAVIFGVNGDQYTVLDLNTNTSIGGGVKTIASYVGGSYSKSAVKSSDNTKVYKIDQNSGGGSPQSNLVKLNWDNNTNTLSFNSKIQLTDNVETAYGLAISNTNNWAFVASRTSNGRLFLDIVNTNDMSILVSHTIAGMEYYFGQIAFDEVNKYLYVAGRRNGGEATVMRATISIGLGYSDVRYWDFQGAEFTARGLALSEDNTKIIVGTNHLQTVPTASQNVNILNASQFDVAPIQSFQGAALGLGANVLPTQVQTAGTGTPLNQNGKILNISVSGDKYAIGMENGSASNYSSTGDISDSTITTFSAQTDTENAIVSADRTKVLQLSYTGNTAITRSFDGNSPLAASTVVSAPSTAVMF